MMVKLLTEHHLEFLSLKGGCRGSSESTLVKTSNCWKSHAAAHISLRQRHMQLYGPDITLNMFLKGLSFRSEIHIKELKV